MEKTNNKLDCVRRENNKEEKNKLDIIKSRLIKTTDFLRTGYQNRRYKRVAPLMTTSEDNTRVQNTKMKNKIKLERKKAINTETIRLPAQYNESRDDSSEEEDDEWDSLSISNVEYEIEQLFHEVYHRCTNLVGQDINGEVGENTIVNYLKRAFEYSDHRSEMLIRDSQNKQYPRSTLKVNVLKTRDVLPKDIFSVGNLFFIIWISSDPAKYYTGKIAKNKPIDNQTFKLPFSSSTKDVLYLELRDIIPSEDETIRGNERISEPIGSAQIMLKDILSAGQTKWIALKRPSQGTDFGKIQLRMMFGSEENAKIALERHRCLLKILFRRLIIEKNYNLSGWKGTFSPEAELILKQHFIQSNLNTRDDLIAKWAAYVDVIQSETVNFHIFDTLLDDLLLTCELNSQTKQKKRYFWCAATKMMLLCYQHVKNFRNAALNQKETLGKLHAILSILHNISNCKIPPNLNLFPAELYTWVENKNHLSFQTVLHEAVVQGACEWFEFLVSDNSPGNDTDEAKLDQMIKVAELVLQDLDYGMDFHGIFVKKDIFSLNYRYLYGSIYIFFNRKQNVAYIKTIFHVYQKKITDMMKLSVPKICREIKQLNLTECYRGNIDCNSCSLGSSTCELFFKIQRFHKIGAEIYSKDVDTFEKFPLREFHSWFLSAVNTWLDIAILKAMRKIDEAVEMEYFLPIDTMLLHSNSADDVMNIMYQVIKFWDQLEWPDMENSYFFLVKIIQDVSAAVMHYADLTINKIISADCETKKYSIDDWCVAIANIAFVFDEIQPLASDERLRSLANYSSMSVADRCQRTLNEMMKNSFENINKKIIHLLEAFSKKMEPSIERFLQEGAELLNQQPKVVDYLKEYLDENLISLSSKLNPRIFLSLLNILWQQISKILDFLIENGIEKKHPTTYFFNLRETLHILIDFFNIDEKIPQEENEKLRNVFSKYERKLILLGTDTAHLIRMYQIERLKEQEQLEVVEDGILKVELQLDDDKLNVEILGAFNVMPMDSNGQSDPFVRVEFLPWHKFAFFSYKTKILKKTLHPVFDEKFTVPLTKAQIELEDALIKFIVKDHDLCKNRYMAEAYVRLNDAGKNQPKLHNLKLSRPRADNDILKLLEARRAHDKLARIFLKKEKLRMKVETHSII